MDRVEQLHQQRKIQELSEQLDQAHREASDWREKAEAIHQEYMELSDQIRRGDFIKARRVRLVR